MDIVQVLNKALSLALSLSWEEEEEEEEEEFIRIHRIL